jgi:hypothetical protein
MAYLASKKVFIIKEETTPGTPETLTASDFDLVVVDGEMKLGMEFDEPNFNTGSFAKQAAISGLQNGTFACKVPLIPASTVATAPKYKKLFAACGAVGAAESTTGYSIKPLYSGIVKPVTVWELLISNGGTPVGILQKLSGAMGSFKYGAEGLGKPIYAEFNLTGKWTGEEDINNGALVALNVLTGNDTAKPYTFVSATISGITGAISSFSLDGGVKVEPQYNPGDATTGMIDYYSVIDMDPRFSANPLVSALSSFNPRSVAQAGTLATISISITSDSKPLKLTIPSAQIMSTEESMREGLTNWNLNYKCLQNGIEAAKRVSNMAVESTWEILQGAKS